MADEPSSASIARTGPMPPHIQLFGILGEDDRAQLLEWAVGHERLFKAATIYRRDSDTGFDPDKRTALNLREFGPLRPVLEDRLMARLPEIMAGTGYNGPPPTSLEFELNAYGHGAFFKRHIDVSTGRERMPLGARRGEDRVLSAVYYFYNEPKGFTGGALRLYRFGAGQDVSDGDFTAYEPMQDSMLAFPAWASHEVERVSCPSGKFSDYRFGLNCWFCRALRA